MTDADKLYRITLTIYEMLEARGFSVPALVKTETEAEFKTRFKQTDGSRNRMSFQASDKNDNQIAIWFCDDVKKTGIKSIKDLLLIMEQREVTQAIMIARLDLTPPARTFLQKVTNVHIEYFMDSEVIFNITKHKLVPLHIKLSNEDKQEILQRYNATLNHLPRILSSDPVARFYGAKTGDIFKIIRTSPTAGRSISYRALY